mgnify:CR=1 FL=1
MLGSSCKYLLDPTPQTALTAAEDAASAAVQAPSNEIAVAGASDIAAAATATITEPTAAVGTSSDIIAQGSTTVPGPKRLDPAGAGKAHGYYR